MNSLWYLGLILFTEGWMRDFFFFFAYFWLVFSFFFFFPLVSADFSYLFSTFSLGPELNCMGQSTLTLGNLFFFFLNGIFLKSVYHLHLSSILFICTLSSAQDPPHLPW